MGMIGNAPYLGIVNSSNIADGSITPVDMANRGNEFGWRNRIINGDMRIDQRNAGASVTGGVGYTFPVDRFKFYSSAASKLSGQRSTTAPTGFTNSLLITSLAATTPAASDEYQIYHMIEGFNTADFSWGTASAQTVTVSFWVRSSLTGTFSGAINNEGGTRSYVFTYAISAANTWEQKTITIPGDTTGTWATGNTMGLQVVWDLGSGSNLNGTVGTWASGFDTRTSGAVSLNGTNGATFYITGVQLEAGSVASPFERRDYGREEIMCKRYFQTYGPFSLEAYANSGGVRALTQLTPLAVPMRATPTRAVVSSGTNSNVRSPATDYSGLCLIFANSTSVSASIESTAAGLTQLFNRTESLSAEL